MGSTIDNDLKVTGTVSAGNVSNPPRISGGSGAISTTNKSNGSMHLRTDADTLPEVMHNSAAAKLALGGQAIECRMVTLVANQANTFKTYIPRGLIVTGVKRRFDAAPASAGGTVVTGITLGGNQILASASEDEEGITNDTLTAHSLTGTSSNLKGDAGDVLIITVTSNNGDMTNGENPMFYIEYDEN